MTQMSIDAEAVAPLKQAPRGGFRFDGVTVIIPCYNEEKSLVKTVGKVSRVMRAMRLRHEVIVVDDGSTDGTPGVLAACERRFGVQALRNGRNCGYGYSLKRALRKARYEIVVITDADGTYPNERIADLVQLIDEADMVVGARTGGDVNIPLVRRPAKWVLQKLASYLAGTAIPDLNSGLRVMKRDLVEKYIELLPDGFSFTTTITLAMLTHDYEVRYVPIDYAKRVGKSSIRPIHDTAAFLSLIIRTVMYFKPLHVFGPLSALLFAVAVVWALVSLFAFGQLADVSVLVITMASVQMLAIGMLADLISKRMSVVGGGFQEQREPAHPAGQSSRGRIGDDPLEQDS
jgi:glycosyltransferase involved in cell wall biosynthesis